MDWVGVFLFSSGFFLFLVGLNWGGKRYPWNSAAVISAVVIGAVELIAFVIWGKSLGCVIASFLTTPRNQSHSQDSIHSCAAL